MVRISQHYSNAQTKIGEHFKNNLHKIPGIHHILGKYFYWKRWCGYQKHYWGEFDEKDYFRPNGISKDDHKHLYLKVRILQMIIKSDGNILDLGCGNGLLLKMVTKKSPHHLTPYGVDFLKKSILQAKKLFPECPENFIEKNIINYTTENRFEYIIASLGYEGYRDTEKFLKKCLSLLEKSGKLIIMNPVDTYKNLEERIPVLQKIFTPAIKVENYGGIYWIVFEKSDVKPLS